MSYNANFWNNYETWNIHLWHGDTFREDAAMYLKVADGDRDIAIAYLAGHIEGIIYEWAPGLPNSPYTDILYAALAEVDYRELAEFYMSDEARV